MEGRYPGRLITFIIFIGASFLFINKAQAAPDYPVISQVQTTGGPGQTTNDFIEFFNPTDNDFDLKGHRLVKRAAAGTTDTTIKSWTESAVIPARGFYLWANSSFVNISITPDVVTSQTIADNNGIALRQGAADSGAIIDSLAWGSAVNIFVEGNVFPDNPTAGQSLKRKITTTGNRQDSNDNSQDFSLDSNPAPRNSLSSRESTDSSSAPPPPPAAYHPPLSLPTTTALPQPGEVAINELVSDPIDGSEEWIELYNRSSRVIDLSNFTIEEGSRNKTLLNGSLGVSEASRYIIFRSPKGNLNNNGDIIILRYMDIVIDKVTYGNWDDGNTSDNTPAAGDPLSIGRLPDGLDSDTDKNDFILLEPTPAAPNRRTEQLATDKNSIALTGLQFNELYPNPPLGDESGEFIELINLSDQTINLENWTLADKNLSYVISRLDRLSTNIEAGSIWLLPRSTTSLILDNFGTEKLTLTSPDKSTILSISYQGPAPEGASYTRGQDDMWIWTTQPTPGENNIIKKINTAPILQWETPKTGLRSELLVFDASDSFDPEKDELIFNWNFGDGVTSSTITPTHIYSQTGRYTVKLEITDSAGNKSTDKQTILIEENSNAPAGMVAGAASGPILITELMPNPQGSDNYEWLELYNPSEAIVLTTGWKLIINHRVYKLPTAEIAPASYYLLDKKSGGFSLSNKNAEIYLESPVGQKSDSIKYSNAGEGIGLALEDNQWHWTNFPTPGQENIILGQETDTDYQTIDLDNVRSLDSGSKVRVIGIVASIPDLLDKNMIFIAGSGIQVNLSSGNWPKLEIGDKIQIAATLSKTATGTKLLLRHPQQLSILGKESPPAAQLISLNDINDDEEGKLISTAGLVSKVSSTSLTLRDGDENLIVNLKNRALDWPKIKAGAKVKITGFVTINRNGLRLLARSPQDIIVESSPAAAPQIINLDQPAPSNNWAGYLLVGGAMAVALIIYLAQKYNWPSIKELTNKVFYKK